jgi:glycerol-3-phosphate dehydrogenase
LSGAQFGPEFSPVSVSQAEGEHSYGSEMQILAGLPGADVALTAGLTEAMVRFAARHEYAVTVEDMLARRSRLLFLDARLAARLAPRVAEILREETGLDPRADEFAGLAAQYLPTP